MRTDDKKPLTARLYQADTGIGVILPPDILANMELKAGDVLTFHYNWQNDQAYFNLYPKPLSYHALLLLEAVKTLGVGHITGEVYKEYEKQATADGEVPLTSRRISGLLSELESRGKIKMKRIYFGKGASRRLTEITV